MNPCLPGDLDDAEFGQLLRAFEIEAGDLRLLGRSQNSVYEARRGTAQVIVRVSTQRHRSIEETEAELGWMEFLNERGLPVCPPLRSTAGRQCERMDVRGRSYLVAVFPRAPGRKASRTDLTETFCARVGELIGRLHQAARDAENRSLRFPRKEWSVSRLLTHDFDASPVRLSDAFRERVALLIAQIGAQPAGPANFGLLHGDVNLGNLHVEENGDVWVYDFDNCEYGFFAQDLATMLYDSLYSAVVKHVPAGDLGRAVKRSWGALVCGYRRTGGTATCDPAALFRFFLLREAVLYVHYHRVIAAELWADPFLLEMRRHVEEGWHPLDLREFTL